MSIEKIRPFNPPVLRDLIAFAHSGFADYASHLYRQPVREIGPIGAAARSTADEVLRSHLKQDLPSSEIEAAIADLTAARIWQLGPHLELLLDPVTLQTYLTSAVGALAQRRSHFAVYAVSTITLQSRARSGPGWVGFNGQRIRVFDISRDRMARTSVCGRFSSRLSFNTEFLDVLQAYNQPATNELFDSAGEALQKLNRDMWGRISAGLIPRPIVLSDDYIASLAVSMLKEPESCLAKLLFDDCRLDRLRAGIADDAIQQNAFFRWPTDFFWRLRDGRVRKLVLNGGKLSDPEALDWEIPWNRDQIIDELESGTLIPSLFIMFTVLIFLPCARPIGGPYMIGYLPTYLNLFLLLLDEGNLEESILAGEVKSNCTAELGMCIASREYERAIFDEVFHGGGLKRAVDSVYSIPLEQISGQFEIFRLLPIWNSVGEAP